MMFDYSSYYDKIAGQLPNNARIVEVGSANGDSAIYLAKKLKSIGNDFTLFMVDSLEYGGKNQLNTIIANVVKSGCVDNIEILPFDSLNASLKFNDNSLDFVYIDSGHTYQLTRAEIKLWYAKLFDNRILAGHDYTSKENPEVRQAVDELIPKTIVRSPIIVPDEKDKAERVFLDKFKEEELLVTEDTEEGNGIWSVLKRHYWKP